MNPLNSIRLSALLLAASAPALPSNSYAAEPTPVVRRSLSFVKFNVNDLTAMQAFYEKGFGMQVKKRLEYPTFVEVILSSPNGLDLALVKYTDGRKIALGTANGPIGFYLKDVVGAHRQAVAAGGVAQQAPRTGGGVTVGFVEDPEGHEIELLDAE